MNHFPSRRALDAEYVSEIVGQPVKSFTVSEGSKKGDNVVGKMLALNVETEEGTNLDVVVKSLLPFVGELTPEAIGQSHFYIALELFPSEVMFYDQVRPLLQQVTGYSIDTPKIFSTKADGIEAYIALEDLRPSGYKMGNKQKGLNAQEVTKVFQKLAMLHAHSYAVLSQNNPTMQEFKKSVLNGHVWLREIPGLDQELFFNTLIEKMVEVVREIGDPQTASKMERFVKTGHKIVMDLWRRTGESPKYFEVFIHGDLWTNNVLFKYAPDGEAVEDLTFIDFQQCRFGNIYEDLLYFVFTSTSAEFRKNHLRPCLQSYFKEFQGYLENLENPIPLPAGFTDEDLIATFYENIEYGLSYELVGIPFQLGGDQGPPQDQVAASPQPEPQPSTQEPQGEPTPMMIALMMAEIMKQGTKNNPVAIRWLKELCAEMTKLNVLS